MVKSVACRRAVGEILQMVVDDQQIPEDFKLFIDDCLSDYFYQKRLDYSLTSILKFRNWFEDKTLQEIKDICDERLKDNAENTNEVNEQGSKT